MGAKTTLRPRWGNKLLKLENDIEPSVASLYFCNPVLRNFRITQIERNHAYAGRLLSVPQGRWNPRNTLRSSSLLLRRNLRQRIWKNPPTWRQSGATLRGGRCRLNQHLPSSRDLWIRASSSHVTHLSYSRVKIGATSHLLWVQHTSNAWTNSSTFIEKQSYENGNML